MPTKNEKKETRMYKKRKNCESRMGASKQSIPEEYAEHADTYSITRENHKQNRGASGSSNLISRQQVGADIGISTINPYGYKYGKCAKCNQQGKLSYPEQ